MTGHAVATPIGAVKRRGLGPQLVATAGDRGALDATIEAAARRRRAVALARLGIET